jgi:hypothetical protein
MTTRLPLPLQADWAEYELWIAEVDRDMPTLLSPQCHPKEAVDASHEALRQHLVTTRMLATGGALAVVKWAEEQSARAAKAAEAAAPRTWTPYKPLASRACTTPRPPRAPRTPRQGSLAHLTPAEKRARKLMQTRLSNARKREERKLEEERRR